LQKKNKKKFFNQLFLKFYLQLKKNTRFIALLSWPKNHNFQKKKEGRVGLMSRVTVKTLTGRKWTVPIDGGTMREWMLRHAATFGLGAVEGNSFAWQLIKTKGTPKETVNSFEYRHRPVSELLDDGDELTGLSWMLGSKNPVCKNNLMANAMERATECAYCLEDFTDDAEARAVDLDCGHRFHLHCLLGTQPQCIICTQQIDNVLVNPPDCKCCRCSCQKCKK
jgi:hypothetical protein